MLPVTISPIKRAVAAVLDGIGFTSLAFALQRAALSPFIRVLYYHDVTPGMSAAFRRQLALFKQAFVPASKADLEGLLTSGHWPHAKPGVILTFDDGLRSHSEVVAPILEELGFEGWFFVPIDLVETDPAKQPEAAEQQGVIHFCDTSHDPRVFMTPQQLVSLSRRHVVGCHTATHVRLARSLSEEQMRLEIDEATHRLEAVLGRQVDSFSWVGGEEWAYSAAAAQQITARFGYAFTTNTSPAKPGTPPLRIDRTHVEATFSLPLTRLQICGLMDFYYRAKRRRLEPYLPGARGSAGPASPVRASMEQ
jgi:peptidoglycan/xylan/chitin deacetylase (PgdA/CDA1 family)